VCSLLCRPNASLRELLLAVQGAGRDGWCCYFGRPGVATGGGRRCYLRRPSLLLAKGGYSTLGLRCCYQRRAAFATGGCQLCYIRHQILLLTVPGVATIAHICLLQSDEFSSMFVFCYISITFLLQISGEVSGETPASSGFFFYFIDELFFATCSCCRDIYFAAEGVLLLHIVHDVDPTIGNPGLGNQIPRNVQHCPKI
jgi:hypothetical protein